ncbi:MAG: type II and III secretion system protein, partial [Candidatus Eremiobacteraeota bacterium]|nr:type II and III secretion system protein [Candidatus Eremiobacteraeota bacterium]
QTTVNLQDNETLVIGGLIQDNSTRTENKLPLLGDLPLIGKLFRSSTVNNNRNELVIVVTPHVLGPGASATQPGPPLPVPPTPAPLPTIPPARPIMVSPSTAPAGSRSPQSPSPSLEPVAPEPTPSAFANTNTYTYGQTPTNTFAGPTDPVQIFYATFSPTVLQNGTLVQVYAITTTNVNNLSIGYSGNTTSLAQISPGKWQASYNFNTVGLPVGQHNVQLTLTAKRIDGPSASVAVPISIAQ